MPSLSNGICSVRSSFFPLFLLFLSIVIEVTFITAFPDYFRTLTLQQMMQKCACKMSRTYCKCCALQRNCCISIRLKRIDAERLPRQSCKSSPKEGNEMNCCQRIYDFGDKSMCKEIELYNQPVCTPIQCEL